MALKEKCWSPGYHAILRLLQFQQAIYFSTLRASVVMSYSVEIHELGWIRWKRALQETREY